MSDLDTQLVESVIHARMRENGLVELIRRIVVGRLLELTDWVIVDQELKIGVPIWLGARTSENASYIDR